MEIARQESYQEGKLPLHTFRAKIDFGFAEARTTYGVLGIKVWIMKGEVFGKRELSPLIGMSKGQSKGKQHDAGKKQRRRK